LSLRIVSALALAPLPLIAIWFGGAWLALLTISAATVMAWEWGRLCRGGLGRDFVPGGVEIALAAIIIAAVAIAAVGAAAIAIGLSVFGAGIVFWAARQRPGGQPVWTALGVPWVAVPCICFLWLGRDAAGGRTILLWLLAVVWATDIGAYAVGRGVGGPRLAPRWSPRKTWAGLAGGILSAGLAGAAMALALRASSVLPLVVVSAGLAVVAQFGDLAESLAKRRFGVKDTSGLIPGHGGLFDRLDGLLAVIPVVALMTLVGGQGMFLPWQ